MEYWNVVNALLEALKNMNQQRFDLIRRNFETIYHTLKAEGLKIVATKEIAFAYNMSVDSVELEMKKLLLRQVVQRFTKENETFWKYNQAE